MKTLTDERHGMTGPWTPTGQSESKKSRTWWIVGGVVVFVLAVFVAYLAGRGWDEATGPSISLDQQQQAWEEDLERRLCEAFIEVGEDSMKLSQSLETLSTGKPPRIATPRLDQPGCRSDVYGWYLHDRLIANFPDSPKGQAGETTKPAPTR